MEIKLITEISRNRQLMGLLNEQIIPRLGSEVGEFLTKKFANITDKAILDDIEQLSRITSRKVRASDNDYVDLVSRLIKSKKEISDYLVPKIIKNLSVGEANYIAKFKKGIRDFKKSGATYEQTLRSINSNLKAKVNGVPVFNTPFPEVISYLKKDLERYAYEIYNPGLTTLEKNAGDYMSQFKQGWNAGKESKSGGFLFGRQVAKGLGYVMTLGKAPKWFPRIYKNLNAEERGLLTRWMITGLPDWKIIQKTWKDMGGVASSAVVLRQLISKFLYVATFVTIARFFRTFIQDNLSPEKEYKNWDDETTWDQILINCHRFYRSIDWPSFGVTSPAIWFVKFLGTIFLGGASGGGIGDDIYEYIIGSDENEIPKSLKDWKKQLTPGWLTKDKIISRTDSVIQDAENTLDTLLKGQNVDTSKFAPADTMVPVKIDTANTNSTTDTNSTKIKPLFFNYLKDSTTFKNIGQNDMAYIEDIGNNQWTYSGKLNKYTYKFDPATKTFTQIKKEPIQ